MSDAPSLEWKAIPSHIAEGPAEVRHKDGWLVCEVSADSYARLIAAAPDMLEALQAAREALNSVHETDGLLDHEEPALAKIDAALSKATAP